jgi:hypothetical protein
MGAAKSLGILSPLPRWTEDFKLTPYGACKKKDQQKNKEKKHQAVVY